MQWLATILVGIDFSPESDLARRHAVELAKRFGSEVVLGYASVDGELARESNTRLRQLIHEENARSIAELEGLVATSARSGARSSHVLIDDHPDPGLVDAARDVRAALIVVGTHGRSGIKRLVLGSVAERTVRHAECDVLVARGDTPGNGLYQHILVPTDFSMHSEQALRRACNLVAPDGEITLLHCIYLPPMAGSGYGDPMGFHPASTQHLYDELGKDSDARGRALLETCQAEPGVTLRFSQSRSQPVDGIRELLAEDPCDLVVIGSHGRRGLRRWILGSVTEQTVREAPCSVWVVHVPEDAAGAMEDTRSTTHNLMNEEV